MRVAFKLLALLLIQAALLWFFIPSGFFYGSVIFSLGFLAILLFAFFFINKKEFYEKTLLPPLKQFFSAILPLAGAALIFWKAAFFPEPLSKIVAALIAANPDFWQVIFTSIKVSILFLPSVFLLPVLFSWDFIKKFRLSLSLIYLFLFLQIWFQAILALFYNVFSQEILFLSYYILSLVPGQIASFDAGSMKLTNGEISAIIAPSCIGLGSMTIFTVIFVFLWINMRRRPGFSQKKAVVAFLGGLAAVFLLNILRIVLIMLVANQLPIALKTFHNLTGALFVFIVFLIYLQFVFPRWIIKGNVGKTGAGRL